MDISLTGVSVYIPFSARLLFKLKPLSIAAGSSCLIQGPSGRGKTTLLHLMAGLFHPDEGKVMVGGRELRYMSEHELCKMRWDNFGFVFQKSNLIEYLTAEENVMLGLPSHSGAHEALKRFGIESLARERTSNLSLGEQQRIAVARAFARAPKVVFADEPTSSLDEENARKVMEGLFEVPSKPTLVVVSHDRRLREHFDQIIDFDEWVEK